MRLILFWMHSVLMDTNRSRCLRQSLPGQSRVRHHVSRAVHSARRQSRPVRMAVSLQNRNKKPPAPPCPGPPPGPKSEPRPPMPPHPCGCVPPKPEPKPPAPPFPGSEPAPSPRPCESHRPEPGPNLRHSGSRSPGFFFPPFRF